MHPLSCKGYLLIYHLTKQYHSLKYEEYEMSQLLWSAPDEFYNITSESPSNFWMLYDKDSKSTHKILDFVHLKKICESEKMMERYLYVIHVFD